MPRDNRPVGLFRHDEPEEIFAYLKMSSRRWLRVQTLLHQRSYIVVDNRRFCFRALRR
jgi:hypothetical protein